MVPILILNGKWGHTLRLSMAAVSDGITALNPNILVECPPRECVGTW